MGHPPLQVSDNGGYNNPSGILGSLPLLALAGALKEVWKREAGSEMMDAREDGNVDNLDDTFSFRLKTLL
jgi:hypothetical protein